MNSSRGARVTLTGQWIRFGIQVAGFVILSRLISPESFGIMAMVTAVVGIAALFADLGLSLAGIQAKELLDSEKTSLFWLNVIAGGVGAIIIAGSGPLLKTLYGEPAVVPVCIVLALGLLITSLTVQARVELVRHGEYGKVARQDVLSVAGGFAIAVVCAISWGNYWALVVQSVSQPAIMLFMCIIDVKWRPGRPAGFSEMGPYLKFGGDSLALQVLNLGSRSADVMALGRHQGPSALGNYSRASQLIQMLFQQVVSPLTRVTLPRLSRASSKREFQELISRLHIAITYVLVGTLVFTASAGPSAVVLLLGNAWSPMAPIVEILCLGGVATAFGYIFYWAALAKAQTRKLLWTEMPARLLMIIGSILLAPHGTLAVATVIAAGNWLMLFCGFASSRSFGVDLGALLRNASVPLAVFAVGFTAASMIQNVADSVGQSVIFTVGVWLFVVTASLSMRTVRRDLKSILRLAKP